MAIQETKSTEVNRSIDFLKKKLLNIFNENRYINLTKEIESEIKQKIVDFNQELDGYKMLVGEPAKTIKGAILTGDEILEILKESSSYNNWYLDESNSLDSEEIQSLKEDFGVSFKQKEILKHRFHRAFKHRDEVTMVIVTALPGYNYVVVSSDRATDRLDGLQTPEEFKKNLMNGF